jgi:hypothetical protein
MSITGSYYVIGMGLAISAAAQGIRTDVSLYSKTFKTLQMLVSGDVYTSI